MAPVCQPEPGFELPGEAEGPELERPGSGHATAPVLDNLCCVTWPRTAQAVGDQGFPSPTQDRRHAIQPGQARGLQPQHSFHLSTWPDGLILPRGQGSDFDFGRRHFRGVSGTAGAESFPPLL